MNASTLLSGLATIAIAVSDLDAAMERFRMLGFNVTPKGEQPEWGTQNALALLGRDQIELISPKGEGDVARQLRVHLKARGDSLVGVAFGSENGAGAAEILRAKGIDLPLPRTISRVLEDGTIILASEAEIPAIYTPGLSARIIQYVTNERERNALWLTHPNTALGVHSVTSIVDDPVGLTDSWDRIFGPFSATITDQTVTVHTGNHLNQDGLIFLSCPDDLTQLHPEAELDDLPPCPALVALTIRVKDTNQVAKVLDENDIDFSRDRAGTVRVPPSQALGVMLEFSV